MIIEKWKHGDKSGFRNALMISWNKKKTLKKQVFWEKCLSTRLISGICLVSDICLVEHICLVENICLLEKICLIDFFV